MFSITSPPRHGSVEHLVGSEWLATDFFSMTEVYNNLVSYRHDGTETTADSFRFTVTDSTNNRYSVLYDKIITTVPGDQEQVGTSHSCTGTRHAALIQENIL